MVSDQPGLLDWEPPAARRCDPETSHLAAARAKLGASHGRLMVLRYLAEGPKTDYELAAATGIQQNSIGKRRGECRDHGLVEVFTDATGVKETRPSPTGSPTLVWRITDQGREFYAKARASA